MRVRQGPFSVRIVGVWVINLWKAAAVLRERGCANAPAAVFGLFCDCGLLNYFKLSKSLYADFLF